MLKKIKSSGNWIFQIKTRQYRYFLLFVITITFYSCKEENQIEINGNLSNLPDGMMYLCQDNGVNKVDSVKTVSGKFNFNYTIKNKSREPVYFCLHHIDNEGNFKFISFPTYAKYREGKWFSSMFLSDSIVTIDGDLVDVQTIGIKFDPKTKMVHCPNIIGGYQTNAMFHVNGDLMDNFNKNTYGKMVEYIKQYPKSFHLLYEINNNRNSFSATQIDTLLNLFKGPIMDSDTFNKLKDYKDKRLSKKPNVPLLSDNEGNRVNVLDAKFKKHIVVFWASWCGPCRQEIPTLKELYPLHQKDIEFVSISIDENDSAWQKALEKEQMPWKQLILKEKSAEYVNMEIIFQLSPSIPYVALMDNDFNVVRSHVGLMTDREMEIFWKIK
ncbi:MAG: AhpC/TSA family protein [Flavobacterium sp. JAD_PAG50586_2]|nr:MAG: AhpC/TSA family protein [Flavobacterium sp. JAD_PAG50586_2]